MTERRYLIVESHGYGQRRSHAAFGRLYKSRSQAEGFVRSWRRHYPGAFGWKRYELHIIEIDVEGC